MEIAGVQLGFSLTRWTRDPRIQLLGRGAYGEVTLVQDTGGSTQRNVCERLDVLGSCWKWLVTGISQPTGRYEACTPPSA